MVDLYVYYKVPQAHAVQLEPIVRALQARLAQDGVTAQLRRRPESKNGLQTWMEIYPEVDTAFQARLEALAEASGMATLLEGPRRPEVFVEFTACA